MAKKKRKQPARSAPKRRTFTFNPEQSPYFAIVAFALILVAVLILFSDFVFSSEMLRGSDTIQAGYFFRSFLVDYVKDHGKIPGWNPYIFCGLPYVAAFHGDIFYPLSLIKYLGPLDRMLGWILIMHIYLAGIFMYLCARQFRLGKIASLVSGVAYMFAPYLVSFISPGHDGKIFVTTLFPLVILFLDRGFEKRPFLNFSLLGTVIGFIILSPHPQMAYFTLWCVAFYAAYKLILLWRETGSIVPAIKPGVLTAYAVVIGLLLSAIQFYPGYIYTTHFSPRAEGDSKSGWEWATSWSLHEEEAMGLLIPEFPGANTQSRDTYYWGKNAFKDNSESVMVTALFLALIGFFFSRRTIRWFFGGLGLFALLYALADTTPFFHLFYLIPKVSSMRAPAMIMFIFSFCIALLAGMGVQYLIDRYTSDEKQEADGRDKKLTYLLIGFPVFLLVVAFLWNAAGNSMLQWWGKFFYDTLNEPFQRSMTKMDLAQYNLGAIQSGAWFSFLAITAAAGIIMLVRSKYAGRWLLLGLALIICFNSMRFNSRFIDTIPFENVFKFSPIDQFLEGRAKYDRVMDTMRPNSNALAQFGFYVPYGYHGNQLRWYDRLAGGPEMANRVNPKFINMTSSHWLVASGGQQIPPDYFGPKPLLAVRDFGPYKLYENYNSYPRVYLADDYQVFDDVDVMYHAVYAGQDDLQEKIYLEKEPPLEIVEDSLGASGAAQIADYGIDSIVINVNTPRNQLLVLTDTYYDAWHAEVDGQPAEILRANTSFRAVAVPAGARQVVMYFESARYQTGRLVTLLTSIFLVIIVGFYSAQSYRNRPRETEPVP